MSVVYKIVSGAEWETAVQAGRYSGSAVDDRDGFMHLSATAQVRETAARHFAGMADLRLVAVRTGGLDIRWEPSRGGDLFPHLYADLPLSSVAWVRPLPLGADGLHVFPELEG